MKTKQPWVKKLGQWHLYETGSSTTICGKPMLGNNYSTTIPMADWKECPKCHGTGEESL